MTVWGRCLPFRLRISRSIPRRVVLCLSLAPNISSPKTWISIAFPRTPYTRAILRSTKISSQLSLPDDAIKLIYCISSGDFFEICSRSSGVRGVAKSFEKCCFTHFMVAVLRPRYRSSNSASVRGSNGCGGNIFSKSSWVRRLEVGSKATSRARTSSRLSSCSMVVMSRFSLV